MVRSTSRQMRAGTIPSIWSIPSQRLAAGEAEAMSGNIVVCCDGTSNKFSARRTNVAKLCFVMEQKLGEQEHEVPGAGFRLWPAGGYPRRLCLPDESLPARRPCLCLRIQPGCLYSPRRDLATLYVRASVFLLC